MVTIGGKTGCPFAVMRPSCMLNDACKCQTVIETEYDEVNGVYRPVSVSEPEAIREEVPEQFSRVPLLEYSGPAHDDGPDYGKYDYEIDEEELFPSFSKLGG